MKNAQEMELKNRALPDSEMLYCRLAEGSLDGIVAADGKAGSPCSTPRPRRFSGTKEGRSSAGPSNICSGRRPVPRPSGRERGAGGPDADAEIDLRSGAGRQRGARR